jgi:phosphoribosylamine--glycine ligase
MNILLIGSGGREHALAWAMAKSPRLGKLYIAPGNPGTQKLGQNVNLAATDHAAVVAFCDSHAIDLVVIGPEAPLVDGLADPLRAKGYAVFGPSRAAACLEGSKAFTKALCDEAKVPTAAYARFTDPDQAVAYVHQQGAPIVIKADGLAAGKGVVVAQSVAEAEEAIRMMASGGLGDAGSEIVIEECLVGEEVSFFVLSDGETALPFASAQDHKAVGDGDTGPNTGGMGAYSPASVLTPALTRQVMDEIILPSIKTMKARGTPFQGVLFAGLMLTAAGPKLIEYNVRFGDPECEVMMPRLKSDLVEVLDAAARQNLHSVALEWHDVTALTVIYAANGYPAAPEKGSEIKALDQAEQQPDCLIFHAGTTLSEDGRLLANGGRVLAVTGFGHTVTQAKERASRALAVIDWPGGFHRSDIGWREIARENSQGQIS